MAGFKKPFRARPITRRPDNVLQFQRRSGSSARSKTAWWAWGALFLSPVLGVGVAWTWHAAGAARESHAAFNQNSQQTGEQYADHFSRCSGPIRYSCVVDGDTFWLKGDKIRIADINTPEISKPQCPQEADLGARATERLIDLLNAGGFSLTPIDRDNDVYGRRLRIVTRLGNSIGDTLVAEGLAERWQGVRRIWC